MPSKKKRRIMRKLQINEISSVPEPAQEGATVVFMKRAEPEQQELDLGDGKNLRKELADFLTSEDDGHQHGVSVRRYGDGDFNVDISYGLRPDDQTRHDHPVVVRDGQYELGVVAGHTHTIEQSAMSTALLALLAKGGEKVDKTAEEIKADQEALNALKTQLDRANNIVGLDGDERSHFDALEGTEPKDSFLAKSADGRKEEVEASKLSVEDADPVVYTTSDGIEIRKSAGEALVSMAKSNDAIAKENKELRASREQEVLEKRATDDLAYMPGTVQVRAAMLKAIDGIGDKEQREAALSSLKAQNDSMAVAFTEHGTGLVPAELGSAAEELDQIVSAYAKDNNVGVPAATAAVLETAKGQELYQKRLN